MSKDLIVQLYQSLFDLEQREQFTAEVLRVVGGSGATWFSTDHALSETSFFGYVGHDFDLNAYLEHYFLIDDWHRLTKSHDAGTMMVLSEDFNRHHFGGSVFFNEFCLPQIKAAQICTANVNPATNSHLSIYRDAGDRPFASSDYSVLQDLLPHLENWRKMHVQYESVRENLTRRSTLFDTLQSGVAIVNGSGVIIDANSAFETMLRHQDGLASLGNRLHCQQPADTNRLDALIQSACAAASGNGIGSGGGLIVQQATGPSLLVTVMPWPKSAEHSASNGLALVFVREQNAKPAATSDLLKGMFGLSQSEAEIAELLTDGLGPKEISAKRETSVETVRTQIKSVLSKTGSRNRTELVRRVLSSAPPIIER